MRCPGHVERARAGLLTNDPSLVKFWNHISPGTGHVNEGASKRSYPLRTQVFSVRTL